MSEAANYFKQCLSNEGIEIKRPGNWAREETRQSQMRKNQDPKAVAIAYNLQGDPQHVGNAWEGSR